MHRLLFQAFEVHEKCNRKTFWPCRFFMAFCWEWSLLSAAQDSEWLYNICLQLAHDLISDPLPRTELGLPLKRKDVYRTYIDLCSMRTLQHSHSEVMGHRSSCMYVYFLSRKTPDSFAHMQILNTSQVTSDCSAIYTALEDVSL